MGETDQCLNTSTPRTLSANISALPPSLPSLHSIPTDPNTFRKLDFTCFSEQDVTPTVVDIVMTPWTRPINANPRVFGHTT